MSIGQLIRRARTLKLIWLPCIIFALLLFPLLSNGWANIGGLHMFRMVLETNVLSRYPLQGVAPSSATASQAMWDYSWSLRLNQDNTTARWGFARVALAIGDYRTAAQILEPLVDRAALNGFLYLDFITAFGLAGSEDADGSSRYSSGPTQNAVHLAFDRLNKMPLHQVALLAKRNGSRYSGFDSTRYNLDLVVLAWLRQADLAISAGDDLSAEVYLHQVLEMRPSDLYASYYLWRLAKAKGDLDAIESHEKSLVQFPSVAITPFDNRLLNYSASVIPAIVSDGLWDREKALNVVSYWVWQHYAEAWVEPLVRSLSEHYPTEPEWLFSLGELYHRQGALNDATDLYRQALEVDPKYSLAYLRLGMVAEAVGDLHRAAECYSKYHEMAPDDLLGLEKLVLVKESLGDPEAIDLRSLLRTKTDVSKAIAEVLDVPRRDSDVGPNLFSGIALSDWNWVNSWVGNGEVNHSYNQGAFAGGLDSVWLQDKIALRVSCMWVGVDAALGAARAGYTNLDRLSVPTQPGRFYVLSFLYRTTGRPNQLYIYAPPRDGTVEYATEYWLPETKGMWREQIVLFANQTSHPFQVIVLIRGFGGGTMWFRDIQLREVLGVVPPNAHFETAYLLR